MRWTGNDEWGAGFINEDVIHFIDNGVVMSALDALFPGHGDVVAQVIKTKFAVGSVRNVGLVSIRALDRPQQIGFLSQGMLIRVVKIGKLITFGGVGHLQDADLQAQQLVNRAHPTAVAAGKVIVHCDEVRAFALKRVQVKRQRGGQGLALACAQLGDAALVQVDAADELHVIVAHAEGALAGFAHSGKGLG